MDIGIVKEALNLGVAGLFFVMFWMERKDRISAENKLKETLPRLKTIEEIFEMVVQVLRENTEALDQLRASLGLQEIPHRTAAQDRR